MEYNMLSLGCSALCPDQLNCCVAFHTISAIQYSRLFDAFQFISCFFFFFLFCRLLNSFYRVFTRLNGIGGLLLTDSPECVRRKCVFSGKHQTVFESPWSSLWAFRRNNNIIVFTATDYAKGNLAEERQREWVRGSMHACTDVIWWRTE